MAQTTEPTERPPDPARRDRERSRLIGLAVIGGAAVIALVVTVGIFIPAICAMIDEVGTPASHDPATLPEIILVCGYEYARPSEPPTLSLDEVQQRDGRAPVIVAGAADAGCPDGTCVNGGMCLPAVYVATGTDRYVAYELQDGP